MKPRLRRWLITFLELIGAAILTAVVTIGLAGFVSDLSGQSDLADRVDRNIQVVVCILQIPIEDRSDERIQVCLDRYGFPEPAPVDEP